MNHRTLILSILLTLFVTHLESQDFNGLWYTTNYEDEETYLYLDSVDNDFYFFHHFQKDGEFGKGKYDYKKNNLILNFDSITIDKLNIEILDNNITNDTSKLSFFNFWNLQKDFNIYVDNDLKYSFKSEYKSMIEPYTTISIVQPFDNVEMIIYDSNNYGSNDSVKIPIKLNNKKHIRLEYFPEFEQYKYLSGQKVLKIKRKYYDYFDIKGETNLNFKRFYQKKPKYQFNPNSISIIPFDSLKNWSWRLKNNKPISLSFNQIKQIDSLIFKCIWDNNNNGMYSHMFGVDIGINDYFKQLVPSINNKGEIIVWVNSFCVHVRETEKRKGMKKKVYGPWFEKLDNDWKKDIRLVNDGGNCFFNVYINLTRKTYFDLYVNGK